MRVQKRSGVVSVAELWHLLTIKMFERWFGKRKKDDTPVRDVEAMVRPLAVPAVHVLKTKTATRSHFGGDPNLPPGLSWPEYKGERLGFLARISLDEVQRALPIDWLPTSGSLLFFYDLKQETWGFDPKDRGSFAVLHVPDLSEQIRLASQPPDQVDDNLQPSYMTFKRIEVLPSLERESARALHLDDKESDLFYDLVPKAFGSEPRHQIAGFPDPVQGDGMELECQLVTNGLYCGDASGYSDPRSKTLEGGAANWKLLFQIDSDDALNVMWGDAGLIYFWVEENAAKAGDFSNTWLILQCS